MKKVLIGTGIAGGLVLAALLGMVGFWFTSTAFAQGPNPGANGFPGYGACHNNTGVLQLLGMSQQELIAERQAGKSLLDVAKAKGTDEAKLTDALMQPVTTMHAWMGQTVGNQGYADQMTQQMRDWIAKDIRESKLGTMTDFRLGLSGNGPGYGMMDNWGFPGGMMGGRFNPGSGFGGMMGSWR